MGAMDKMKNAAEGMKGDAKTEAGRASGDQNLEAEGRADKGKADLKQAGEKVKDAFKS